jgi:lipopolysaccharide/colanic/teichoic acid biosynthesis glycosyltransferase
VNILWVAISTALFIVGGVLLNVLGDEVTAWLPRLARWLVRRHASHLQQPLQERMREEWEALLADTPGHLSKVSRALDLFRAVPGLRHEFDYPGVPYRPLFDALARGFDVVLALTGLVLGSPIFVAAVLAVKCESKGSVFTRHPRLGRNKSTIVLYKLRTVDHEGSPRITRTGRVLRRMALDEWPQTINVLLGHVSFIGPRPLPLDMEADLAVLNMTIPPAVFSVRPGITGRAQLLRLYPTGGIELDPRGPVPFLKDMIVGMSQRRFAEDVEYVMRRGLVEHLRIIAGSVMLTCFHQDPGGRRV